MAGVGADLEPVVAAELGVRPVEQAAVTWFLKGLLDEPVVLVAPAP